MRGINGKIILMTGGCGDLGIATATRLGEEGATVILGDILDVEIGLQRSHSAGAVDYLRFDQAERAAVERSVAEVVRRFGRLDIAIANAACVERAAFIDATLDQWNRQLNVNLTGYFNLAQTAARIMLKQEKDAQGVRGKILMTSSWVGQHPLPGAVGYVVSKAGVDALVRAAAQELSPHGIRVNAVAPGLVYSGLTKKVCDENPKFLSQLLDFIPLNELGNADQVASAYAFLCSDDANYMTGHVLVVDGGCSVIKRPPA